MKIFQMYLLLSAFMISYCNGQKATAIQTIGPAAFSAQLKASAAPQLLDVRSQEEYVTGHIENADNVNWLSDSFVLRTAKYKKTKAIYLYCKSGGRSAKAAEKLAELGFTKIYNLQGGMLKWEADGFAKADNKIIGISKEKYNQLVDSDKEVLINFYAPWCAPCKLMEPYISSMQKQMSDKVEIIQLNADQNKSIMQALKISELPTLLLYKNKEIQWQKSGYISEEELKKQLP